MREIRAAFTLGPTQRMTLDDAVQDRCQSVKRRRGYGVAASFQTSSQRAGHSALASGAWNRKGNLLVIESLDKPLWDLDRAAGAPSLSGQTDDDRPSSDEVVHSTRHLEGMKSSFRGCIKVVVGAQSLANCGGFSACQFEGGFVAQRKPQGVFSRRLGHHRDGNRPPETVVEITNETISDTYQFVGGRARYRDLDTPLKATPERPEIFSHDR